MITSLKIWNEPNNVSHWDFERDPGWEIYGEMVKGTVRRVRETGTDLPIVLGGLSPIDARFLRVMQSRGVLDVVDVLAVHGFPLDWNLWPMHEWPGRIEAIRQEFGLPVWVTETGVSSFASEKVAEWGLRRSLEVLRGESVHWYSLLDLAPDEEAATRHKEAEGTGYFRHFHFGLLTHDGRPKRALRAFDPEFGICQWFQYRDERSLRIAAEWLEKLGVRRVRTGLSWAESLEPGGWEWFDTIISALEPFEVCATLCFTPKSRGLDPHHTSPPRKPEEFAEFAGRVASRYAPSPSLR